MKKLFLAIAFLTLGMSANAQGIISDLDEEILIGTWGVTDMIGQFSSFNHEDRDKTVMAKAPRMAATRRAAAAMMA